MKRLLLAASACILLASPALAMTEADCVALWKQADADHDGMLKGHEGDRYAAGMRLANKK